MATIEQMKSSIKSLSDCPSSILPSREELVDNYVSVTCKDAIDKADDPKAYKQQMIDYYTDGPGAEGIDNMINDFNESYISFIDGIDDIKTSITNTTASNAVPAVIVAGSATGVSNPAYTAIDNAQKKHVLKMNLRTIKTNLKKLLSTAVGLNFEVPDSIISQVDTVSSISSTIEAIPG